MPRRNESERTTNEQTRLLTRLQKEFASFRQATPRPSRVPDRLRAQVLAAVDAGIRPTVVCRTCGVTHTQISHWRALRGDAASGSQQARERAQVLHVVDSGAVGATSEEVALEVGVGSWRLTICLRPDESARR
jgi:hypothetical protein